MDEYDKDELEEAEAEVSAYAVRIHRDAVLVMYGLGIAAACLILGFFIPAPWSWISTTACAVSLMVMTFGALGMTESMGKLEIWIVFASVACFVAAAFANAEPLASSDLPVRVISAYGMVVGVVLIALSFLAAHLRYRRLERELEEELSEIEEDDGETIMTDGIAVEGEGDGHAGNLGSREQELGEDEGRSQG